MPSVNVELQAPQDLHRAMALARAYEQRSSALDASTTRGRPPRPPMSFQQHAATTCGARRYTVDSGSFLPVNPSLQALQEADTC
jgi:hypothetical protein